MSCEKTEGDAISSVAVGGKDPRMARNSADQRQAVTRCAESARPAVVGHGIGGWLRGFQTGYLRSYVLFLALAATGLFALFFYFVTLATAG